MKEEKARNLDAVELSTPYHLNRREFLGVLGGGIVICISCGDSAPIEEGGRGPGSRPSVPEDFNAFLHIGEDGRVTCLTGKIEMGQGPMTSLPQLLADELDVALGDVDIVMGDTDLCPWDMGTFGSLTIRVFGPLLRAAAAEARAVLIELASEQLGVPAERLKVENGVVFDSTASETKVTYAELAKGKTIERHLDGEPVLKTAAEFKVMGKSFSRRDALEKVTGEAKYAGDILFEDMLYARILRPPVHGAKRMSVDTSAVEEVEGTVVVEKDDLVAVLHEYPDMARRAMDRVRAEFDTPSMDVDDKTIFEHLLNMAPEGSVVEEGGSLETGEGESSQIYEETYFDGYVAHAPIETHTAVAKIEGDKATVWASTQAPFRVKGQVAEALGFPSQNVRVITPFVGAGFGGKVGGPQAVEAALLARETGRPVQVAWTREEEFFFDTFRPAAVVKVKSGTDDSGKIVHWDYKVYLAGSRGSEHIYNVPHFKTVAHGEWRGAPPGIHPFAIGPWRAPACNTNAFARESHIDIMAYKLGRDPLEFRLENLTDERMRGVLTAVAEKFGWTPSKAPSGRGYGIACSIDAGTYVAFMAEVDVSQTDGSVQVERMACAQDMGLVVNPEGAKMQMEGCMTMGLGYALTEDIRFKGGDIYDTNFDTYELPRFSWLHKIETVILDKMDAPAQGGGEPAITGVGAVIANAVFDATGARLHQMPMTPKRVLEAVKQT
jgi:isoquinoline 1-oxidoreductase